MKLLEQNNGRLNGKSKHGKIIDDLEFEGVNIIYIYTLGIQSPCQMMIGVYNHLLRKVFRFHYHSQKVIGSIGIHIYGAFESGGICFPKFFLFYGG